MLRLQGRSPDKIEEFVNVSVHGLSIVSRKAAENAECSYSRKAAENDKGREQQSRAW